MNRVKVVSAGRAICPICGSPGEYEADGQTCSESEWVWENGNLIAVPARNWGGRREGAGPPRKMQKPVKVTISLEANHLDRLKDLYGRDWQDVVRSLIGTHLHDV